MVHELPEDDPRYKRRHAEQRDSERGGDIRTPAQHDRDRILYSPEFRRLSGITQVISPTGNYETHNRLTHTLEVAHVAKAIVITLLARFGPDHPAIEKGGGLDVDVVEAAAFAHDIGHPPFGHVTEEILKDILRDKCDFGFEGNAQSFRILTTLSIKDDTFPGLNLTRATLSAVSKYPWFEGRDEATAVKWGAYNTEKEDLVFSREHLASYLRTIPQWPDDSFRTLEARVMDWADDVAYAIHDVEDFFQVGMIPLDRLKADDKERERFLQYYFTNKWKKEHGTEAEIREVSERLLVKTSPFIGPYTGSTNSAVELRRRSSFFINRYITNVELWSGDGEKDWYLDIDPEVKIEVELLKSLLWYYVIENRALLSLRYGYANLIEELFNTLHVAAVGRRVEDGREGQRKKLGIFPEYFRAELEKDSSDKNVLRLIADFIASLTESQAIELHHRLTGIAFGKSLDRIV